MGKNFVVVTSYKVLKILRAKPLSKVNLLVDKKLPMSF